MTNIQDIIFKYVNLKPYPNSQGWHQTRCLVCNDHTRKGLRAGFRFDNDSTQYHCFNCGQTGSFNPAFPISTKFKTVLDAFGIPESEFNQMILEHIGKVPTKRQHQTNTNIIPDQIQLPDYFYPLTNDKTDDWCQESIDYLKSRHVNWQDQPFYCVKETDDPRFKQWYGRLIIPVYYENRLIFYQGRDLTGLHKRKYLSPGISKQNILFGYDRIQERSDDPLYVVEGWFDAILVDGVAIFGNKLSQAHIAWLNKTKRPKVIIPDKYGDGQLLAQQALKLGWSISTPDFADCKDINETVDKYGLLYTLKTIQSNIVDGPLADIHLNIYCE